MSVLSVRWLGGSFAKLGFSFGLCGFANVPPNALAYVLSFINLIAVFSSCSTAISTAFFAVFSSLL